MESIFDAWHTMRMDDKKITGSLIRRYRRAAGLTQRELAVRIGMTDRRITAWESQGEFPGRDALTKLAKVFGVGVDDLIGEDAIVDAKINHEVDLALADTAPEPALATEELRERAARILNALVRFPGKLDRWVVYGQGLLDGLDSD